MHVWITEAMYAVAFFAVLALLAIAPWIHHQYRRFGLLRGWPALVSAATVLYACALVAFTLFPLPDFANDFCVRREDLTYWQLTPMASLDDVALYLHDHTIMQTLLSGVVLQVVMNIVFFVPLGVLVAYRWRRPLWVAGVAAIGVSLAIELTQGTGLWGLAPCPYRLADVDDLLTNTIGGLLGWFVGLALRRLLPDPAPRPTPDLAPPSWGRRSLAVGIDTLVYLLVALGVLLGFEVVSDAPDEGSAPFLEIGIACSFTLFVLVPALRRTRSGPGAASVRLALVTVDGRPAPRWRLLVRWAARWLVLAVFGLLAFVAVLVVEGVVAWRRTDGRSLSDVATGTTWVTRQSWDESAPS